MAAIELKIFGIVIMADLFLELFSEEIPARLQVNAQLNLKNLVANELLKEKSHFDVIEAFSTPRRLVLIVKGLSERTESELEEKRGPNVLAPDQAIEGFCNSMKIDRDELVTKAEKKGEFYYARLQKATRLNSELLPKVLSRVLQQFPWPKSMRWGSGRLKWVRPLRSIVCLLCDDNQSLVLPLEFNGVQSGCVSEGHRFLSSGKFSVSSFEDYQEKMRHRHVILDREVRKEKIWGDANTAAFAVGLELIKDEKLLDEVTGLVEWPVILMGKIDKKFLSLPDEVLQVSMREHQKFFSLRKKNTNAIESFIMVANILSKDNGRSIVRGNERVLNARLSDAKFFWENDLRQINLYGYESFKEKLQKVTFHNKLGTQLDRIKRIEGIATNIARLINADSKSTKIAASICKLDLVSEMVFEFPELQGLIGKRYAEKAGYDSSIAQACDDHYLPRGALDDVPRKPVSIALALADKIDTICEFWSIDLKPSGSKDPFALRRAAIGIIRILLDNKLRLPLVELLKLGNSDLDFANLIEFFNERIKVQFTEQGIRLDVINSLHLNLNQNVSLKAMASRALAIQNFISTESGKNLIQGYKRAVNILSAEEKRDNAKYLLKPKIKLLKEGTELKLFRQLENIDKKIVTDLKNENDDGALLQLSELRDTIDSFFDEIQINSKNAIVRRNRLCLLNQIKETMHRVSDFSEIEG